VVTWDPLNMFYICNPHVFSFYLRWSRDGSFCVVTRLRDGQRISCLVKHRTRLHGVMLG